MRFAEGRVAAGMQKEHDELRALIAQALGPRRDGRRRVGLVARCEDADAVRDQMAANMATGRFTTPTEVATIVALLASPRLANVTGANWVIDGGLVKTV